MVDTFGTGDDSRREDHRAGPREFQAALPKAIIETLDLRKPIYKATAAYGHFGRKGDGGFTWERTDRAEALRKAAGLGAEAEVAAGR